MKKNIVPLLIAGGLALAGSPAFAEGENVPADDAAVRDQMKAPADSAPVVRDRMEKAPSAYQEGENVPADNSGKNVRDRSDQALTPGDQSESDADVAITREIRKAVVDDDNLSVNAQNVKIITVNGVVTLRGPVKNATEKETIAAKAKTIPGVTRVENQIELTGE